MKQTVATLLADYTEKTLGAPVKLTFTGVEGFDVYNITAPFMNNGQKLIAGRVEKRDSEASEIKFFIAETHDTYVLDADRQVFALQDPFVQYIHDELVLGGVETYPLAHDSKSLGWRTVFYKGADVASLTQFFTGPTGMKDLRLMELHDGRIGVLTRPQHEEAAKGGRGKIGFTVVDTLADVTETIVMDAPLYEQFVDAEWGGGNSAYLLENGMVGILGHIACFDETGDRHYYSMTFEIDPDTMVATQMKLLARRDQFLPGDAKRPDLEDVIFSGGLLSKDAHTVELYVGVSDAEAQYITLANPFSAAIKV